MNKMYVQNIQEDQACKSNHEPCTSQIYESPLDNLTKKGAIVDMKL